MYNRVRCELVSDGPGPNESIVKVKRADGGWEEIVTPKQSVDQGYLRTQRVGSLNGTVLIELSQESVLGNWRLWVPEKSMEYAE